MHIVSTGMVCPVGLNAESACAAMRAGVSAFEELPYCDNNGEPIMGAIVPGYALEVGGFEKRLVEMLACAVEECLGKAKHLSAENLPLFVALAEPERPGFPSGLAGSIICQLEELLGIKFHPDFSRVIQHGHTSGFEALNFVRNILKTGEAPACIVCGVDSYIRASSLLWLNQHFRLKTEVNSDGVIPGEAAAAVLVCANRNNGFTKSVSLIGLGFGMEKANVQSEEALLGIGLTEATRAALAEADIEMHKTDFRLSDVTGESYGFKEQVLTLSRIMRVRKGAFPIWHCAEYVGDVGAAASVSQLIIAFHALIKGYAPGKRVVCFTSAVFGERAVTVLQGEVI